MDEAKTAIRVAAGTIWPGSNVWNDLGGMIQLGQLGVKTMQAFTRIGDQIGVPECSPQPKQVRVSFESRELGEVCAWEEVKLPGVVDIRHPGKPEFPRTPEPGYVRNHRQRPGVDEIESGRPVEQLGSRHHGVNPSCKHGRLEL